MILGQILISIGIVVVAIGCFTDTKWNDLLLIVGCIGAGAGIFLVDYAKPKVPIDISQQAIELQRSYLLVDRMHEIVEFDLHQCVVDSKCPVNVGQDVSTLEAAVDDLYQQVQKTRNAIGQHITTK